MNASHDRPRLGDRQTETLIGYVLRSGVFAAASVVLAGAAVYLLRHGFEVPHYGEFRGEPADLRSVAGIVAAAASCGGAG